MNAERLLIENSLINTMDKSSVYRYDKLNFKASMKYLIANTNKFWYYIIKR